MANCCNDTTSCGGVLYSSNCVTWASDAISAFSIEKGDNLTSIVTSLSTSLTNALDGVITFPSFTVSYQPISDLIGTDYSLKNILDSLISYDETLKNYIDSKTTSTPVSYDNKCLTVTTSLTQAIIDQVCANKSNITTLTTQSTTNTSDIATLKTQVANILGDDTSSAPAFTPSQLMPPWVPMPYIGALTNFDSTGKGLSANGYDKVYIMNGNNGTQDWRGYIPMGANAGVNGPTLDPRVNPTNNSGFSLTPGQKSGEVYHKLTLNESPAHTHPVNDPGHSHNAYQSLPNNSKAKKTGSEYRMQTYSATSIEKTGITIGSVGGGQPHNNMPPVVATVWIVKIP